MKTNIIKTLGFALITSNVVADKNEVRLHECPENVRKEITQKMQGGKLDEVKIINLQGKPVYVAEVDFTKDREVKIYVSDLTKRSRFGRRGEQVDFPQIWGDWGAA